MTGYMFVAGACFGCGQPLCFNASLVPSIRYEGRREPICRTCVDRVNPLRIENGLEPIVVHAEAYQPEPVI